MQKIIKKFDIFCKKALQNTNHISNPVICVLQTPAQILLCDLTLKPGEEKKIVYREKIPVDAPPSYAGSLLKYSYKLTVSIQRVGGSIRQVRIPFRVLVLYGLCDYQGCEESPLPSNPFLETSASNGNNGPAKSKGQDGSVRYRDYCFNQI